MMCYFGGANAVSDADVYLQVVYLGILGVLEFCL